MKKSELIMKKVLLLIFLLIVGASSFFMLRNSSYYKTANNSDTISADFSKLFEGYNRFKEKYANGDNSIMKMLSQSGQSPKAIVVACCDSRVDPAVLLQCEPGELFIVRNVANIIAPNKADYGMGAALEFAIRFLKIKDLIILGHSQCGGIERLLSLKNKDYASQENFMQDDFIFKWASFIKNEKNTETDTDSYAKLATLQSRENALEYPWIKEAVSKKLLTIHLWFFDIKTGRISVFSDREGLHKEL